jgi:PST family polysaccharide transporter
MAVVSSVIGPLVLFAVRKNIIHHIGLKEAGFWEAMNRMSSYYFLFITSILGLYFLPKLAVAKNKRETKKLFWSYYTGIMPIFLGGLVLVFILKEYIIGLVFTKDFMPIAKLFFWQLIGDAFKAASYVLGFQFYAKKLTKAFILSEICSLAILYGSSLYFMNLYQLEGIVMAYAFTYLMYLIVLATYFRKSLF